MNRMSAREGLRKATLYGLTVGGFALALAGCNETKKILPSSAQCYSAAKIVEENPGLIADYSSVETANDCLQIKRTRLFAECPE